MITTTAQIIAQISDPKQAEKLRGKGVVEKKLDDTTYLIRFSSGKIKVKVTSGTLAPDTIVQVKSRGGKIILQPVPATESQVDRIVLTGTKQEVAVNKAVYELLSIITDSTEGKGGGQTGPDYASIIKKLATFLQDNQHIQDLSKDIQALAKKVILFSSKIPESPDKQAVQEMKALVQSFQQKLIELCFQQQNSIKLTTPVEQGFIYFSNKEEAIEWLVKTQPHIDKNALDSIVPSKSEPVIIRTINTGDGTSIAIAMNEKEGAQVLDTYIHNEGKNPLWETLPPDLLLSILESKGSITIETIESIDKILQLYTNSSQPRQIQPEDIAKPVMQQWIALMIDNDPAMQTISSYAPAHSAGDIAYMVEHEITKSLPKSAFISEIIKEVLTNTINNPDIPKTEIISNAFDKMGYNLEHELARVASSGSAENKDVSDNVKAALLSLMLQTMPQGESPSSSHIPAGINGVQKPVYVIPQFQAIDIMIQNLIEVINADLEKIIVEQNKQEAPQSEKTVYETIQTLKKITGDFIQQLSEGNQRLFELLNVEYQSKPAAESQAAAPQVEITEFTSQLSGLLKNLTEAVKGEITEYLSSQQHVKEETGQIDRIEIEKLLNTLLQFVEKQKQEIQHYNDLLRDVVSIEAKQLVNTLIGKTSDIITRIAEQLEALLKSITNRQNIPLNMIESQNAAIKQITEDKINSFFRPLDNLLNALGATLKPIQTGHGSTSQIQALTDNIYKAIVDSRSSMTDEIAALSQDIIKNVESRKGYSIGHINAAIKRLIDIVNSLNNKLSPLLTAEKAPIENAFRDILQHFNTASAHWSKESTAALSNMEQHFANIVQELKESFSQSIMQQVSAQKDSKGQLDSFVSKILQGSISETADSVKQLASQISNHFKSPRFSSLGNLQQQLQSTFKAVESSLKSMMINLRNTISGGEEKFINSIHELQKGESSQATASKNIQSIANRLSYDISRILDNTLKEMMTLLEKMAKEVEKNPEHLLRQLNNTVIQTKQEIDQLIKTINRQIVNLSSRAERAFDTTLPDGIRRQVETALSQLETLQLLAKPTPTSEGQQQILSLPMKIGDEWTDVNILLIKKRDKSKSKISSDKFAVRMYVSPSQCGPIIVNMDYHVKHKLTVRIEFEKNDARNWFNKYKEQLIAALRENGMSLVALSLESAPRKEPAKKIERPALPVIKGKRQSKIDISI